MVAWNYLYSGGLAFLDVSVDEELLLTKDSDALKGSTYIDLGQFYRPCTTSSKQVIYSRVTVDGQNPAPPRMIKTL